MQPYSHKYAYLISVNLNWIGHIPQDVELQFDGTAGIYSK